MALSDLHAGPALLAGLIDDLRTPDVLWQVAAVAVALAIGALGGWWLRRSWRRAAGSEAVPEVVQLGVSGLSRMLTPLLVLMVLLGARAGLERVMHVNLIRVAISLTASLAVIRAMLFLLHRVFTRHGPLSATLAACERIFALLVWVGVGLSLTGLWDDMVHFLAAVVIPLGDGHALSLLDVLQGLLYIVVLLMLALWAGAALEDRLMKVDGLHTSLRVVLARTGKSLLILVAVLTALNRMHIDLTALSVFGGALGVGLGLGLQKIASNYVSGFAILLERSLKIGDMITVDKFTGRVTQINARYTVLHSLDGTETVVPNEMLISGAVQNFSLSTPLQRASTQLTVSYDTDVLALLPLLAEACRGIARVLDDPAPAAGLVRLGPNGFELDVGMWIADPHNGTGGVVSQANARIWKVLQDQGVSIPSSARDVRLVYPDQSVAPAPPLARPE
jgi:small-conductance mechanosensitive channel